MEFTDKKLKFTLSVFGASLLCFLIALVMIVTSFSALSVVLGIPIILISGVSGCVTGAYLFDFYANWMA